MGMILYRQEVNGMYGPEDWEREGGQLTQISLYHNTLPTQRY